MVVPPPPNGWFIVGNTMFQGYLGYHHFRKTSWFINPSSTLRRFRWTAQVAALQLLSRLRRYGGRSAHEASQGMGFDAPFFDAGCRQISGEYGWI